MYAFVDTFRDQYLKPFYLFVYRMLGFSVISGSLLFLFGWTIVMVFFMLNTTWVAPTFLSLTSDRMLQFSSGYTGETQTLEADKVMLQQAQRDLEFANQNVQFLLSITQDLKKYAEGAGGLEKVKTQQLSASHTLVGQLETLREQTQAAREAGLITNQDVAPVAAHIQEFENGLTDQKQAQATLRMTIEAQLLQASEQLRQAQNDVHTKEETVLASQKALVVAEQAMSSLKNSVYYDAFNHVAGLNLAFIAYDNLYKAVPGAPIYSCKLQFIFCHKVGSIRHVYSDEQLVEFPLFNMKLSRQLRGIFIDMDMTDPSAMRDLVLFIDKPLGI